MRVSAVEVHPVVGPGAVKAVVNVILSGDYALGPFRIVTSGNGLYVGYPKRQGGDGNHYAVFRPLSRQARQQFDERVLSAVRNHPGLRHEVTETEPSPASGRGGLSTGTAG